jgi:hypothetical protein
MMNLPVFINTLLIFSKICFEAGLDHVFLDMLKYLPLSKSLSINCFS